MPPHQWYFRRLQITHAMGTEAPSYSNQCFGFCLEYFRWCFSLCRTVVLLVLSFVSEFLQCNDTVNGFHLRQLSFKLYFFMYQMSVLSDVLSLILASSCSYIYHSSMVCYAKLIQRSKYQFYISSHILHPWKMMYQKLTSIHSLLLK